MVGVQPDIYGQIVDFLLLYLEDKYQGEYHFT